MVATQKQQQDLALLERLAPPQTWQRERVPILFGGMRTDKLGRDLELNESPFILNLTLIANKLVVDTGYIQFGQFANGATAFIGTPLLFYQVFNQDGTATELLITSRTVYQLVLSTMQWNLVNNGLTISTTTGAVAGANSIGVSSTTGLNVSQWVGLQLDNGTQVQVAIQSLVGGTGITFAPPIPIGRSATNGAPVAVSYQLNGTMQDQIAAAAYPAKNWVIFSNGVDPLFYWTGSAISNFVTTTDLPPNTNAQWLSVYHSSLFLFAPEENGQQFPQRVRMSDIGNPQSFNPAALGGPATSIAAIYDLIDTEDFIHGGAMLGPYLIVYRETTIMRGTYAGLLNGIMFWEYMTSGEGVRSQGAVSELGSSHEIVGNGGIYEYTADYSLTSTGDAIFVNFISAIGDLNPQYQNLLFCQYQQDYDENWIFYPGGTSTTPNKMLRHSLEKNGWFQRTFANAFVSASPFLPLQTTTWASAVGTWAQQTAQWNSRFFTANVANYAMCSADTRLVYLYDYKATTDGGVTIPWQMQTKDLGPGDTFQRWDQVRISGLGQIDTVQYSLDEGNTWITLGPLSLGSGGTFSYLTLQAVSAYIRFQLIGTDHTFQFDWLEVWFQQESEY